MHKKLEADLISIAHRILQLKNKEDVAVLYKEAKEVYEKLAVLNYIDNYVNTTPANKQKKEAIAAAIFDKKATTNLDAVAKIQIEEESKPVFVDINATTFKDDVTDIGAKKGSFEQEMKDAISADVATNLFEKAEKVNPNKKSLNQTLTQNNLQIGLNDRIAFVKHLFNNSQEDFNRVLSQLNTFKTEKEALTFVANMVKPDYDWSNKEEYEERLLTLIERKFS